VTSASDLIQHHEGCRLQQYQDGEGYWTIGWGHCIDPRVGCKALDPSLYEADGLTLSQATADEIFEEDLDAVEAELISHLPWAMQLATVRLAVLQDMAFELGIEGLLEFATFLELMKSGEFEAAASDLLKTKLGSQVPTRESQNAALLISGAWPTLA
jgi:lysozyme